MNGDPGVGAPAPGPGSHPAEEAPGDGAVRSFDPALLRAEFPALQQQVHGHPLVYLDNAATTQKPTPVLEALQQYYAADNANVHRGIHELSRRATDAYEGARAAVADWIGAARPEELVWTRGTTEALNLVANSWGGGLGPGDRILLSVLEHHSNLVPWQLLAARTGAELVYIELDDHGEWVLDDLDDLLDERVRIAALSHVSNALGTVNPVADVAGRIRRATDARIVVDGAQAVPHLEVDVQALGVDAYAFSGHKMCAPTGIGGLWVRHDLLEVMEPWQGGGEMISLVEREHSTWASVPHKFEAGTPNIAGAVALGAAVHWLSPLDFGAVLGHEQALSERARHGLEEMGATVYGPRVPGRRSGVVSFTLGDAHPHDISTILDSKGVAIRAGHHCAQLVMRRYGTAATARASFYLYNTDDDVDRFLDAMQEVRTIFG
jgi:cysteine desulfurase/selenocysteine lyase